jgi:hypothetical protein
MAVTIVRTPWVDDDGTGTTGTVINNAVKTALYNDIDGGFAKLAQLAGGNAFTGSQSIAGLLAVTGFGLHSYLAGGSGGLEVRIQNTAAGVGNTATITVGNDTVGNLLQLTACSSTYTPNVYLQPNTGVLISGGTGGLNLGTTGGPVKVWTSYTERLRVTPTGEVFINAVTTVGAAQFLVASDQAHSAIVIQNTNPANALTMMAFCNSAAGVAGTITQSGASAVAYNTSSDARLKDDAGRATDVAALRAVVVHDFAWKADGRTDRGVFAQDAHAVFPRAVSVGTDETTADGTLVHPWMTDYSKFVPDLIVGWQHHDAELAELRALLATVKG